MTSVSCVNGGDRPGLVLGRERPGEREEEKQGKQAAHGVQRLSWATFWSISSEAWMDLEFTS